LPSAAYNETERGLKLFEQITYLKEHYLTNTEIEVLEKCGEKIAQRIPNGCRLVELGSGYVSVTGGAVGSSSEVVIGI
jgi:uncharacterized SAM-dependent methyltransferase